MPNLVRGRLRIVVSNYVGRLVRSGPVSLQHQQLVVGPVRFFSGPTT